ncbi:hypothetical protein [Gordonia iterans]
MQQRIYAAVIALLSIVALALTNFPWADGRDVGFDFAWNGFGRAEYLGQDVSSGSLDDLSAAPLGLWVLLACVVALLAAAATAVPALAGPAGPLRWVAALCTSVAAAVPITVLADPAVFLEGPFRATDSEAILRLDHYSGIVSQIMQSGTLIALIVVLFLTSAACVAAAVQVKRVPTVTSTDPPESETPRSERSD